MKKFLMALFLVPVVSVSFSQPLFSYGNKSVSKTEFLKAFNKNPNLADDKKKL